MSIHAIRIETERLILRPPVAADFDAYAAHMADAEAVRFVGGEQPRARAWRGFLVVAGAWVIQGFSTFSVIEKASGRWIGRIGPWHPVGWPGTEIGWSLVRDAWGKGYAYEGAVAATDWAFAHLGWHEVIHPIHPDNRSSRSLARRLGAQLRGTMRLSSSIPNDVAEIWGQTREQWLQRQASPRS
ncbi:GNAT family N-acetyltransferase [Dyella flava]|uniref:GNAT family N-acetyltransferase n=1 Tax=Dyella flava TaxID=1920170 RepID=A0ABS2K9X9_9GAMM|nr:GNAT family N-acetyltransferase [Dyella flava]MBM7127587.1 GNAT family N-acetyltransferase [Dyella flava]